MVFVRKVFMAMNLHPKRRAMELRTMSSRVTRVSRATGIKCHGSAGRRLKVRRPIRVQVTESPEDTRELACTTCHVLSILFLTLRERKKFTHRQTHDRSLSKPINVILTLKNPRRYFAFRVQKN